MNRTLHLLVAVLLLVPATARAAVPKPPYCESAAADPAEDPRKFIETCLSGVNQFSATATTVNTVYQSRTTVAKADFSKVPTWSDADIMAQFASSRDTRYLTSADDPNRPRRLSWLYPDGGCEARAEQVGERAFKAGKARPAKLFAIGLSPYLRVYTDNAWEGVYYWRYHVVPVVKNSAGQPIVLDAALSPCKPLPWKTWLALMVDDMSNYDDIAAGNGVTIADSAAYNLDSLVTGEPRHTQKSLDDEQLYYLPAEWERQVLGFGHDPDVWFGPNPPPPWSSSACLFTEVQYSTVTVPSNASASAVAACPFATLNVGGGLWLSDNNLLVTKNARNGNGWEIAAKNISSGGTSLISSAVCLTGAPTNASVTTVTSSKVTIGKGSSNSATATCSSGVLVGGGFLTTAAGTPSSIMRTYLDGRTSSTSSSWRASAYNTTSSNRDLTSYAYCLKNTNFSFSQTEATLSSSGDAIASCQAPLLTLGGGFVFPKNTAYTIDVMDPEGSSYLVNFSSAPIDGDPNAKVYVECLSHP